VQEVVDKMALFLAFLKIYYISRNNSLPAKRPKVALACMEYRKKADEGYNATTSIGYELLCRK
jgi:hypothetical protein